MRVAGIMSGTSLDGIDVAIVDIRGRKWKTVAHCTFPYPGAIREELLAISNSDTHTARIARMNMHLPELYADALRKTCSQGRVPIKTLELVGCHGQTIFHEGSPVRHLGRRIASTLQIGDGSVLAERIGIPVVSDFRTRDMAAGGRGAPLVPFVDYLLFRHAARGRIALNIGGIANITVIPAGVRPQEVFAFDTGPGNMVIDELVQRYTKGVQRFDRDGAIGGSGHVDRKLLDLLLGHAFYRKAPPKTAGREEYGREFLDTLPRAPYPDLIATATAFTAATIALAIRRFAPADMHDLIVAGGGAHNRTLMGYLAAFLPQLRIQTSNDYGVDVDAKEAIAFAVLAHETWRTRPSNLPSATGAKRAVVLGKISP